MCEWILNLKMALFHLPGSSFERCWLLRLYYCLWLGWNGLLSVTSGLDPLELLNAFKYQWATCLMDVYIKQKSNQKHLCLDRTASNCWYRCMLEEYNKEVWSVTDDCSCNPSNPTSYPNTLTPTTLLPSECYSPPGDSCDWYGNCLERKYPCEAIATSNGYAIK